MTKKKNIAIAAVSALLLGIMLLARQQQPPEGDVAVIQGVAMTIPYRVVVSTTKDPEACDHAVECVTAVFKEVNDYYNNWNEHSEISAINRMSAYATVVLSDNLKKLLMVVDAMVSLTEGRFDPTVAAAHKLWLEQLKEGCVPTDDEIAAVKADMGWDKVHIDGVVFWKERSSLQIDLCAIAKGYAVDRIVEELHNKGFNDFLVEWGGEIAASGKHPHGRSWTVFISDLGDSNPSNAIAIVELDEQAIATSGDYLQLWSATDASGRQGLYTHIINPTDGRALSSTSLSVASASIRAPTCAAADALATASLVFHPAEEARAWLARIRQQRPAISFWLKSREDINVSSRK